MPRPLWSRKTAPKAAKVSPAPTAKVKNPTPAPITKPKVSPTPSARFKKGSK